MKTKTRLSRTAFVACLIIILGNLGFTDAAQNAIPGTTLVPTAWYVADQGVTLVNGVASTWTDLSGNGNHAVQSASANRPTFVAKVLPNGKPTLRFDGNDRLLFTTPLLSQNWTCFAVARPDWDNNQKALLCGGTGSFEWRIKRNADTFPGNQNVLRKAIVQLATGTTLVPTNAYNLLSARLAESLPAANVSLRLNRSADGSAQVTAVTITNATTDIGGVEFFRGDIAALVVFTNALTDVEVASVEKYLYTWYAVIPTTLITLR